MKGSHNLNTDNIAGKRWFILYPRTHCSDVLPLVSCIKGIWLKCLLIVLRSRQKKRYLC